MHIAILIPWFLPQIGGAEISAYELARHLVARGHRVGVITPRFCREWPGRETIEGISVYRYPAPVWANRGKQIPGVIYAFAFVGRMLAAVKPDLLNLHYVVPTGLGGAWWGARLRLPRVFTLIGSDIYDPFHPLPRFYTPLISYFLGRADSLTAISSFVKERLIQHFVIPSDRVTIIPCGVNTLRFHTGLDGELVRNRYSISPDEKVILAVQRLHRRKGVHYLIEAVKLVMTHRPGVRLLLVGDGPERLVLQAWVDQLEMSDRVIFAGAVPDVELPSYYGVADLFTMHSFHEGLGIVFLEAMAAGKPIVATAAGGNLDIVRQGVNGVLVPPGDSHALAEAMLELLDDPATMQAMGERGRQIAETEYDWDAVADRYLAVFKDVQCDDATDGNPLNK